MKISKEKPPNFDAIQKKFGIDFKKSGVLIAYKDTVHVANGNISPDLKVHEQTHLDQQEKCGIENWWEKYLSDSKFRLEQELEAYGNQVSYVRKNITDRRLKTSIIQHIQKSLAEMYDGMISHEEAKKLFPL